MIRDDDLEPAGTPADAAAEQLWLVSQRRAREGARPRVRKSVKQRIVTTMIGAISRVEERIGVRLWGHGLRPEDCTQNQLAWRTIWRLCREEILDYGNDQVRAADNDLKEI